MNLLDEVCEHFPCISLRIAITLHNLDYLHYNLSTSPPIYFLLDLEFRMDIEQIDRQVSWYNNAFFNV